MKNCRCVFVFSTQFACCVSVGHSTGTQIINHFYEKSLAVVLFLHQQTGGCTVKFTALVVTQKHILKLIMVSYNSYVLLSNLRETHLL